MPLSKPTIQELTDRIQADLVSRLSINAVLRRSVVRVLARCFAAAVYLFYGFVSELSKQRFARSATGKYLEQDGEEWGVTRKSATFAAGPVTFTGEDDSVIPAGWEVQNADRVQFAVDEDITIADGTGTGSVTALEPGVNGNTPEDSAIELISPIAGVDSEAVVAAGGISGGTDQETDALLRERILEKKRQQGLGGNKDDWAVWTKDYPGLQITRVWVFPQYAGARTVGIFFTLDNQQDVIPTQTDLDAVEDYLNGFRPVGCIPRVYAPSLLPISFHIGISPNTEQTRAAVTQSLQALFLRTAAVGGTVRLSHITEAISTAPGESDHSIGEITVDGESADIADIVAPQGHLPQFDVDNTTYFTKV